MSAIVRCIKPGGVHMSNRMQQALADDLLAKSVDGVNIEPGPFRTQLPEGPAIVFFLRQFG